jgi:hypothetical protein
LSILGRRRSHSRRRSHLSTRGHSHRWRWHTHAWRSHHAWGRWASKPWRALHSWRTHRGTNSWRHSCWSTNSTSWPSETSRCSLTHRGKLNSTTHCLSFAWACLLCSFSDPPRRLTGWSLGAHCDDILTSK